MSWIELRHETYSSSAGGLAEIPELNTMMTRVESPKKADKARPGSAGWLLCAKGLANLGRSPRPDSPIGIEAQPGACMRIRVRRHNDAVQRRCTTCTLGGGETGRDNCLL